MKENKLQPIDFRPRKKLRGHPMRRFTIILIAALLIGGSVSVLIFLRNYNYNISGAFGAGRKQEEEETTEPLPYDKVEKLNSQILVFCISKENQKMDFISLFNIKMPESEVSVYSFSPESPIDLGGAQTTVEKAFFEQGISSMRDAVFAATGVTFDKYIYFDETSFRVIADRYGPYSVTVSPALSYKGDFTLILAEGIQNMNGDMLLKYIRALPLTNTLHGYREQTKIIKMILSQAFVPENSDDLISRYSTLANLVETDLTIVEFSGVSPTIQVMMNGSIKYRTAASAEEYING